MCHRRDLPRGLALSPQIIVTSSPQRSVAPLPPRDIARSPLRPGAPSPPRNEAPSQLRTRASSLKQARAPSPQPTRSSRRHRIAPRSHFHQTETSTGTYFAWFACLALQSLPGLPHLSLQRQASPVLVPCSHHHGSPSLPRRFRSPVASPKQPCVPAPSAPVLTPPRFVPEILQLPFNNAALHPGSPTSVPEFDTLLYLQKGMGQLSATPRRAFLAHQRGDDGMRN